MTQPQKLQARTGRLPAWIRALWSIRIGRWSALVVVFIGVVAVLSTVWTPFNPQETSVSRRWVGPSWPHVLGTDGSGRDILSLIMAGAQTTIFVAAGAGIVATLVGISLAALGALTPRWMRETVAVFVDILIAFPVLIIAMMISAIWGGSLWVVIWAVGIGFGVNIARVTRPELRRVQQSDFIVAARASGLGRTGILFQHLLPNVAPVFTVQLSWAMAVAVLAEASLSYLGFGASVVDPSWGILLSDLQGYIRVHPLSVVWPGLAITITVLSLNLLGDALREATDPTLQSNDASPHTDTEPPVPLPGVVA
ncbi:ABC transporter permease [Microbacterium sp. YY-01]|uniref:ABC transporter permease n=1 Tax=Microbacterium sp. YY-01 TaxID=3421634 RepID=UPI003D17B24A